MAKFAATNKVKNSSATYNPSKSIFDKKAKDLASAKKAPRVPGEVVRAASPKSVIKAEATRSQRQQKTNKQLKGK